MKSFSKLMLFVLVFTSCVFPIQNIKAANIDPDFNPNNIITDSQLLNSSTMTISDIQSFLESHNSYLANYRTIDTYGQVKTAAEIIYNASVNNYNCEGVELSDKPTELEKKQKCKAITTVNPQFLLILLQKEQSLVTENNPTRRQLDWATGYGCPDGGSCNPYWQGFGKQVNSAALQFWWYIQSPQQYNYKTGKSYTFSNPYGTISQQTVTVVPENNATAALYNYTPHVYNGNYNVFKLWKEYFPPQTYPNGTLLQAEGEVGVWLIEDGKKRPFTSKVALTSRFDEDKIIKVSSSDLNAYTKGAPLKFANYSLIKSPRGTIYLLVDNKKRAFESDAAFKKIGYNPEEIQNASWEDINSYEDGAMITLNSVYPTGALLQDNKTGGVYWVQEGEKSPIPDKSFLQTTKMRNRNIIPVTPEELSHYITTDPLRFESGELVKSALTPAVYLIDNGQKRPFKSGEDFVNLGYKWENIVITSPQVLYTYPLGTAVTIEQ